MRRRNSASSSSGTFTRNGRIPALSAGSSLKTVVVGAVDVRDMRIGISRTGFGRAFTPSKQLSILRLVQPESNSFVLDRLRESGEALRHRRFSVQFLRP